MTSSLSNRRIYRFGDFELQVGTRQLVRAGARVPVGSKAFEVLTCLVEHAGEAVSKEQLLKTVWPNSFVEESNLSQHVFALRKALGDRADLIVTIPGRGYQFTGAVEAVPEAELARVGQARASRGEEEVVIQTLRERQRITIEERVDAAQAREQKALAGAFRRRMPGWAWGVAAGLAAGAAAVLVAAGVRSRRAEAAEVHTMVVADFQNTTGDGTFDRTLKRALEIELSQSPSLSVMSGSEAVATLETMGQKRDTPLTGEVAREVCERKNRQMLLTGGIASVGKAYLLTLEATDCASGRKLASAKAQAADKEAVLGALDVIADKVRGRLGESAKMLESYQVPITQATTGSLEALKAYSMGSYLASQGRDETETLGYFQRAVELDPQFAMAYGALANTYYNLNEFDLASANYKKAFELSGKVSAKERLILEAHYYGEGLNDVVRAVQVYEMWAATYPQDWAPVVNICNGYSQIGQPLRALPACRHGLELAPGAAIAYSVLTRALKDANQMAEAKAVGAKAVAKGMDSTGVHSSLYEIAVAEGDAAAMARETAWAAAHSDAWYRHVFPNMQAKEAARRGRYREAREWHGRALAAAEQQELTESAEDVLEDEAAVEIALGMPQQARATLARSRNPERDDPDLALERARLGDAGFAAKFVAAHEKAASGTGENQGTLMLHVKLPLLQAELALERGRAQEAIADLEAAAPYELESYKVPMLRAAAMLKAGRAAEAEAEYRKVLENPGVDGTAVEYPLARLGLARAYAAAGDKAKSRAEYEEFLAGWKDADEDLPVLQAARAELARLR